MENLFEKTASSWVRYSEYEWKKGTDGVLYLTPAPKSMLKIYDPLKDAEAMVVDALNTGKLCMSEKNAKAAKEAIFEFVSKYGLLGFMTALPTTPDFTDYDAVYLPFNHLLKEESMKADDYVDLFFPFEKPDFYKDKDVTRWNISDREMIALAMTMQDKPLSVNMCLQRSYAERLDWLVQQFQDWAFTFYSAFFYYNDYDQLDEVTRNLYRQGMEAFGGIAPTYRIMLLDKPTIVWDFYSLLRGIQMMFSFVLTDETKPLRMCKHCTKVYVAQHPNAVFCSHKCKNQYNVYKSRDKRKKKDN